MPTVNLTTAEAGAQITRSGLSWAGTMALDTPAEVTYGFRETSARPDFGQCTDSQMASFVMALSLFSDVANITFTPVNAEGYTDNATMLFSGYVSPGDGQAAFAYKPNGPFPEANNEDGDVWINFAYGSPASQPLGSYDFETILHELGHAIGLDHPGDYNGDANGTLTYQADAGYIEDSRQYSFMSYFEAYETGAFHYSSAAGGVQYAATLLLHDIAAVQRLYGANTTTRTGDTVYGFNSTAELDSYDFTKNVGPVIVIWDAGGAHDVLDTSGYYLNQIIDLQSGAFSNVGGMRKNVAIAEGTIIEDAIGGSADDTITGNAVGNILTGNGGWDTISGLEGNDTINGDNGNDSLNGGADNDMIYGGAGDDTLSGESGVDVLNGGIGDDTMTGGDGADVYYVDSFGDYVVEANALLSTGGSDTVISAISYWLGDNIERLVLSGANSGTGTGNALANMITGNSAANTLSGLGGNDILTGGTGRDIMTGGAGADDFDFNHLSETGKIASTRDRITDFQHLGDDIDLSTIDANGSVAGNGAFKFLALKGAAFTGVKGQLHWYQIDVANPASDKTIIEGDINGDRKADFQIELTGLKTLTSADFIL